jgi:hypothetical protein
MPALEQNLKWIRIKTFEGIAIIIFVHFIKTKRADNKIKAHTPLSKEFAPNNLHHSPKTKEKKIWPKYVYRIELVSLHALNFTLLSLNMYNPLSKSAGAWRAPIVWGTRRGPIEMLCTHLPRIPREKRRHAPVLQLPSTMWRHQIAL